jgi:hypothetical protein
MWKRICLRLAIVLVDFQRSCFFDMEWFYYILGGGVCRRP